MCRVAYKIEKKLCIGMFFQKSEVDLFLFWQFLQCQDLNSLLQNDAIIFFVKIGTCQFDTWVHFHLHLMQICVNAY